MTVTDYRRCSECMNGRCERCEEWQRNCACQAPAHYGIRTQPGWWFNEERLRHEWYDERGRLIDTWDASMTSFVILESAPHLAISSRWDGHIFDRSHIVIPVGFTGVPTGRTALTDYGLAEIYEIRAESQVAS